MIEDLSMWRN